MVVSWFPLWLSLRVAAMATLLSLAVGLWLAWLLTSKRFPGRDLLDAAITLPLVLPPTVLGYYLLVLLARSSPLGAFYESIFGQPLLFTWKAAVLASTLHAIPLLVRSARAGFESIDPSYLRAARSLGATEWRTYWRVTVPLARRSIAAATLLAFARSMGDFGATLMIAGDIPGKTQTASIAIYDAVESGNTRLGALLTVLLSVITIAIVWLGGRLERRQGS